MEYIGLLGSIGSDHPSDLETISSWASDVHGDLNDAGCGPGHCTNSLTQQGPIARGIDQAREFIAHATSAYPSADFAIGNLESIDAVTSSIGGVLPWFSLIHYEPRAIQIPLREFGREIKPGGALFVGFFEGTKFEGFEHAVTPAYRWPVDTICTGLDRVDFDVLETHVRKTKGQRSHAAVSAQRRKTH